MLGFIRNLFFVLLCACFSTTELSAESFNLTESLADIENNADKNNALQSSKQLLEKFPAPNRERLAILEIQAKLYFELRDFDNALRITEEILSIAKKNQLKHVEAKSYKMLGIYHYYMGNYPNALQAYTTSLTFYQYFNEDLQQANLHNNIGLVHAAMGDTLKTLESYQLAEAIYEKKGTEYDIVDIRYNIAGLYLRLRRFDIAIEMFEKVIEKRIEFNDEQGLASVYSDIGVTYKQRGDYELALSYLLKALTYYLEKNDRYNLAATYHNLAEVYNELNQFPQAQTYSQEAIELSEEQGYSAILAGSLQSLSQALFALGEIDKPLLLLERSTEIANKSSYLQQIRANLALLSLLQIAKGDRATALKTKQEYASLTQKLSNDQLNEYLAKFESTELKQQVKQLLQNKQLQQLQMEQASVQRNFLFAVTLSILLILFFLYRRKIDKQLKADLEIKVQQRTQELERVAEQLQRANNVKSQFLANMSHEIRTPLTSIIGQAEAIINGDVEEHYLVKEVDIIHGNSLHLLELINNILDLSKIEANKLELELHQQDLHSIFHELVNMFTEQARSKGLTFEIIHSLPAPFILNLDGLRIKQILINLCSNALKFTHQGKVTVSVSTNENELIFKVSDTGIGLSYSQIQQVFESFTQGDSSISRRFGGSGLGLCLSEQLAKLMHGRIEIESTLNQGSTFSFFLPISLPTGMTQSSELQVVSVDSLVKDKTLYIGTILLADDHDDNRRLIARFLTSLGLKVIGACNGKEAIEQYLKYQPKVILLDIQMPEVDGIEAFHILRQKGCTEPIIALTANAMSHEVAHYIELGFSGHLKKPIERKEFIAMLDKYFNNDATFTQANNALDSIDMSDLILQFKSNLVLEQQDIVLHIKNNDYALLADLAHRIAGAAQMFGFALLSEKAIKLECAIKAGATGKYSELSQEFLNEIDQVLW